MTVCFILQTLYKTAKFHRCPNCRHLHTTNYRWHKNRNSDSADGRNIVRKEEIAGNQDFLLFPQGFPKAPSQGGVKTKKGVKKQKLRKGTRKDTVKHGKENCYITFLTLSQTTNFRLFQTERGLQTSFSNLIEMAAKFSKWIENTVGKGEIAPYEQFLLFPQCFQKTCTADT